MFQPLLRTPSRPIGDKGLYCWGFRGGLGVRREGDSRDCRYPLAPPRALRRSGGQRSGRRVALPLMRFRFAIVGIEVARLGDLALKAYERALAPSPFVPEIATRPAADTIGEFPAELSAHIRTGG